MQHHVVPQMGAFDAAIGSDQAVAPDGDARPDHSAGADDRAGADFDIGTDHHIGSEPHIRFEERRLPIGQGRDEHRPRIAGVDLLENADEQIMRAVHHDRQRRRRHGVRKGGYDDDRAGLGRAQERQIFLPGGEGDVLGARRSQFAGASDQQRIGPGPIIGAIKADRPQQIPEGPRRVGNVKSRVDHGSRRFK